MVDILLATYNGEKYIEQQLDSLINQTYKDIKIIIRDDASNDSTPTILQSYARQYPDIIQLVDVKDKCTVTNADTEPHGATYNFMKLMSYATGNYIMFCDQDDYWLPNKVEVTISRMMNIEKKKKATPILVYSDYKVVDSNLHSLNVKEKNMHIHGHNTTFNRLLVQNYVTGCTMMINKALYEGMRKSKSNEMKLEQEDSAVSTNWNLPYSKSIIMHDWFIALYAAAFGVIEHIPEVTMLYRQHGDNVYGAVAIDSLSYVNKQRQMSKKENIMNKYYRQAHFFKKQYGYKLKEIGIKKQLDEFLDIPNHGKVVRVYKILKGGYMKGKLIMKLGQIVKV